MRSERVSRDCGGLVRRWAISPRLADMLLDLDAWADKELSPGGIRWPGLWIISGYRVDAVEGAFTGETATASLHRACPALAADLRVGNQPASLTPVEVWSALGAAWERLGGRWGGRFDPPDWNHFDLGNG